MIQDMKEILISCLFIFIVGFIIWPPYDTFWSGIYSVFGETTLILAILLMSVLFSSVFGGLSGVGLFNFVSSSVIVYIISMWAIERILEPNSPVHFILYGIILFGFIIGVATSDYLLPSSVHSRSQ